VLDLRYISYIILSFYITGPPAIKLNRILRGHTLKVIDINTKLRPEDRDEETLANPEELAGLKIKKKRKFWFLFSRFN
jgi:hypothetical protein